MNDVDGNVWSPKHDEIGDLGDVTHREKDGIKHDNQIALRALTDGKWRRQ
jgi:hypothetical protein